MGSNLENLIIWVPPLLLAVTMHEAMHGYAAYRLGDQTAKLMGRLTLNPLAHIDPLGTIIIPALLFFMRSPFLFGWAKPVPVNFFNLRQPKRDMVLVAASGPGTNLVLAALSGILYQLLESLARGGVVSMGSSLIVFLMGMAIFSVKINVLLAIFNLIPVPPLDGGRILVGILPRNEAIQVSRLEPYGMFIIVGLMMLDPFGIMSFVWRLIGMLTRAFLGA